MSKKKNTLNDLEEFLKMQASALVTPAPISENRKEPAPAPSPIKAPQAEPSPLTSEEPDLESALKKLSASDKNAFYDLLIRIGEELPNRSKEDTLLINTALYLKGGSDWKKVIKEYWKKSD
jgi:hypothetical protein